MAEIELVANEIIINQAIQLSIADLETFEEFLPFGGILLSDHTIEIINPEFKEGEEPGEEWVTKLSKKAKNKMFAENATAYFVCYMAVDESVQSNDNQMIVVEVNYKSNGGSYFYYYHYAIDAGKVNITKSHAEVIR